jgi:predicted nucleotidyltransferase
MRAVDGSPTTSAGDAARAIALAERISATCSRVLRGNLLSVILHGSLVLGDYLPRSSDVDLLAIVERRLLDRDATVLCTF